MAAFAARGLGARASARGTSASHAPLGVRGRPATRTSARKPAWEGQVRGFKTVASAGPVIQPTIQVGEDTTDMMTYLLQNRILFVSGYLNDDSTTQIVGSLMALEQVDNTKEIKLYMNSPGGSIYNVAGIIDVMDTMKSPISTIAFGSVAHNSTLVLAAGDKGKRYAMPNSRVMMVQPMGGAMGSFVEVGITAQELNRQMRFSNELFAKYTGKTVEEIEMETDREKFLGPEQAVELGIVDGIIGEVSGVSKMVEETIKDFKENSAWRGAGTKT